MKNYKQTASDVLRLVGGEKNVVQVEHCSTRLRFTLADTSKADVAALKKTAGVMGVISSGPQCQVVIGNDVIEVYDELDPQADQFPGNIEITFRFSHPCLIVSIPLGRPPRRESASPHA